jgi:hypothetical protein
MKRLLLPLALVIAGCTTGEVVKTANENIYLVSSTYAYVGGGWERGALENKDRATKFCKLTNQEYELIDEKKDGLPGFTPLSNDWTFKCINAGKVGSQNSTKPVTTATSFDAAKKKCAEIGLKAGSELFGKCVMQLTQ